MTYLFLERREGTEEEREETPMCERNNRLPLSHPQLGTWPATQACALTGIELVTFPFVGGHPADWATPVRANHHSLVKIFELLTSWAILLPRSGYPTTLSKSVWKLRAYILLHPRSAIHPSLLFWNTRRTMFTQHFLTCMRFLIVFPPSEIIFILLLLLTLLFKIQIDFNFLPDPSKNPTPDFTSD